MRTYYSSQQSTYIYIYVAHPNDYSNKVHFAFIGRWHSCVIFTRIHIYLHVVSTQTGRKPQLLLLFEWRATTTHTSLTELLIWQTSGRATKEMKNAVARLFYQELIRYVIRESAQMYLGIGVLRNVNLCRLTSAYDFWRHGWYLRK
jgi:hypothetical protein